MIKTNPQQPIIIVASRWRAVYKYYSFIIRGDYNEKLLKKFAVLKTISSKISTYLHEIDADPQEDDLDFEDEEWMDYPVKPTLAHVILDLLLSPTYRLPRTVTAVRIYRDENIFSVCPRCDVCIEREYQGYCHRCGQHLDWSKLEDAEEIFMEWGGVEDDD